MKAVVTCSDGHLHFCLHLIVLHYLGSNVLSPSESLPTLYLSMYCSFFRICAIVVFTMIIRFCHCCFVVSMEPSY